jgi:hypothetical protein
VIAADWAEGFADAVRLRPEAWRPLLEDREALVMLMPILALCGEAEGGSPLELDPEADADLLARGARAHPGLRGRHRRVLEGAARAARRGSRPGEGPEGEGRSRRPVPVRLRPRAQALLRR